jgi:ferrous-iron efflux pump FieF
MQRTSSYYAFWLKLASTGAVTIASLLVLVKTWGWVQTHSVTMLASLIDSTTDLVISLLSFIVVRYSLKPADDDHQFGHGKAEALAALAQALLITGSALYLLLTAIAQMIEPRRLETLELGVWAMGFSLMMTIVLVIIQKIAIKRTGSLAIQADAMHYVSDILSNVAVLITMALLIYGWEGIDPWVGIMVAAFILWSAWKIALGSLDQLMDKQLPAEVEREIYQIAQSVEGVMAVHNLRSRQSGSHYLVQLYVDLDAHQSLAQAHQIGDAVRLAICTKFPNADVLVHEEPLGTSKN